MTAEEMIQGLPVLRPELVADIIERFPALRDHRLGAIGLGEYLKATGWRGVAIPQGGEPVGLVTYWMN